MEKLLIIDGHNLLFQMFYGMPNKIMNNQGIYIEAVIGFVGALIKQLKSLEPSSLVVLFDKEQPSKKAELLADYKANRPLINALEDNPFDQLSHIYMALDFLNIKHIEIEEFETDDVIASYALSYGEDHEIIISSFDSDFFQLITKQVTVFRYRGKNSQLCDINYLKKRYGILPSSYALFKALVGDSSDNIRGIDKIGWKTASKLVNEYESLELLSFGAQALKPSVVKTNLLAQFERLKLNYQLISLTSCAPMPFKLEELKYFLPQITTMKVLQAIGLK